MVFLRIRSLIHRHGSDDEVGDDSRLSQRNSVSVNLSLFLSAAAALLSHSTLRRLSSRAAALLLLLVLLLLAAALWTVAGRGSHLSSAFPFSLFSSPAAVDAFSVSSLPPCPPPVFLDELPSPSPYPNLSHPCTQSFLRPAGSPRQYPRYVYPVHTFLISFPRSGNSLIRRILEQRTGVITGSAYQDRQQAAAAASDGKKLHQVLLIKHHFVNRNGSHPTLHPFLDTSLIFSAKDGRGRFGVERVVYVVRDPMDVLVSFYLFLALEAQEAVVDHLPYHRFIEHLRVWLPVWSHHVRFFTSAFMLTDCRDCELLVVRYEDFVAFPDQRDARNPTGSLLCFLGFGLEETPRCRTGDGDGGGADEDERYADGGVDDGPVYSSKTRKSLFNPSVVIARNTSYAQEIFSHLTPEMIRLFDHIAGIEMRAFGYWPLPD